MHRLRAIRYNLHELPLQDRKKNKKISESCLIVWYVMIHIYLKNIFRFEYICPGIASLINTICNLLHMYEPED